MTHPYPIEYPSIYYQNLIKNISGRMNGLVAQTILAPLKSMNDFNSLKYKFQHQKQEAHDACFTLDATTGYRDSEASMLALLHKIRELIILRNQASALIHTDYLHRSKRIIA